MTEVILGVISLLVHYHLARSSLLAHASWLGAVVAAVGISLFHRNIEQVAYVMLRTGALVLLLSMVDGFRPDRIPLDPVEANGEFAAETRDFSIVVSYLQPRSTYRTPPGQHRRGPQSLGIDL